MFSLNILYVGTSDIDYPFCQMKVILLCRWFLKIGLLQWQIVLCLCLYIVLESLCLYIVLENVSDNVCSLIKLHPFSAKVFLVAIVCPDFFKLMGLLLRKGKVDDVSDHLVNII